MSTVPQFQEALPTEPSAQEIELKEFREIKRSKFSQKILDAYRLVRRKKGSGLDALAFTGFLLSSMTLAFSTVLLGVGLEGGIWGFTALGPLGVAGLYYRGMYRKNGANQNERRLEQSVEAAFIEKNREITHAFDDWLGEHYSLSLEPSKPMNWLDVPNASHSWSLNLQTAAGSNLQANLVHIGEGAYELRKAQVHSPSESPYFDTTLSTHQLSASRGPSLAIAAGRE